MASNMSSRVPYNPSASLYVDGLHPDVSEAMLFDKFASAGPILSIRVCRDQITRRSLGSANVNFQNPADAKCALDTMNFDLLRGRPLRIMWTNQDPALRESGVGTILIKNLDQSIDNKTLYDLFSPFGNILSYKIITDKDGQSTGVGSVHFETEDAADNAVRKVNETILAGRKVTVDRFVSQNQSSDSSGSGQFNNIFIKNFGDQLDEDQLHKILSAYGTITSCQIATDEHGRSKGFGYCSFETPQMAEEAVKKLNGYLLGNRQLYVGPFQRKQQRQMEIRGKKEIERQEHANKYRKYRDINLYVKNLDDTIDDQRLKEEFSKFGTITSAKVMMDGSRSKGFGFICFSKPEEATRAITEMNETILGSKQLYVGYAQSKEERRRDLKNQYIQRLASSHMPRLSMQLPFSTGMSGAMMPYLPIALGASKPRNYFQPAAIPITYLPQSTIYTRTACHIPLSYPGAFANAINVTGREPLTLATLANKTPQERKQMLGERLFLFIQQMQPKLASPITAMLLEMDNIDLLHMLESHEALKAKVDEAVVVLQPYRGKQPYVSYQEPLTLSTLANKTPKEQKQMLGERLFPIIQQIQPELAGKITDTLLEMDNIEIHRILESRESLKVKVEEVIAALQVHQAKQLCDAKHMATKTYALYPVEAYSKTNTNESKEYDSDEDDTLSSSSVQFDQTKQDSSLTNIEQKPESQV